MTAVEYFTEFPPALATFLMSMVPIIELRGAIPVAISVLGMSWYEAYFWAVLGNMVPVIFLVYFLKWLAGFIDRHWKFADRHFKKQRDRLQEKYKERIRRYGPVGLILFVAIPLPITGGWTGSLVSWIFGLPRHQSIFWIFIGVLIAGAIVTAISMGVLSFF